MNTTFIIGNGFDLNLGLKTSFKSFLEYYTSLDSKSITIKNLKTEISKNIEDWSDLELKLGSFTKNIKTLDEFDEIFDDLGDNLSTYLREVEKKLDISKFKLVELSRSLIFPENYLPETDKKQILDFKNIFNSNHTINIITFNYTKTIEKLFDNSFKNIILGNTSNNKQVILKDILHVHGYLDDKMIVGVNDVSQIANTEFHKNEDILEAIVKSNCNSAFKHSIELECKNIIKGARLFCVFGSSLGITDNLWWEQIGNHLLKTDSRLIIFFRAKKFSQNRLYKNNRIERKIKNNFIDKMKNVTSPIERASLNRKIFVSLNSNIFNLFESN